MLYFYLWKYFVKLLTAKEKSANALPHTRWFHLHCHVVAVKCDM